MGTTVPTCAFSDGMFDRIELYRGIGPETDAISLVGVAQLATGIEAQKSLMW